MSDEEDFEDQLRQEELAKVQQEEDIVEKELGQTFTDKDGTIFEWDPHKKAWFPKIDDDFIAQYQMNYGVSLAETKTTEACTSSTTSSTKATTDTTSEDYQEYCRKYYEHYYGKDYAQSQTDSSNKNAEGETSSKNTGEAANSDSSTAQYRGTGDPHYDYYSYHGYDMSEYYGPQDEGGEEDDSKNGAEKSSEADELEKKKKKAQKREPPKWFDAHPDQLPNVYVTDLPTDITEEEFTELMNKCGLIMFDNVAKTLKVKLYKDKDGNFKGDGLCCYIKQESVDLALQILDGYNLRGKSIRVERAKFEMKGSFDPSKRKKKMSNNQKRKMKERQEKLFDWTPGKPDFSRGKNEKVVIIKNVFEPQEFENDPTLINEIRTDLRSECSKYGDVRKVTVYDRNPEGVASIAFKEQEEADACIAAINGRWFGGKQLSAATWDGKTKYDKEETEEEREKRLQEWENFLETDEINKKPTEETDSVETVEKSQVNDKKDVQEDTETDKTAKTNQEAEDLDKDVDVSGT